MGICPVPFEGKAAVVFMRCGRALVCVFFEKLNPRVLRPIRGPPDLAALRKGVIVVSPVNIRFTEATAMIPHSSNGKTPPLAGVRASLAQARRGDHRPGPI